MILPILGIFFIIYGLCSIIRGKIPFIKEYHGVKNIPLHSRIEGGAILLTGVLLLLQPTLQMDKAPLSLLERPANDFYPSKNPFNCPTNSSGTSLLNGITSIFPKASAICPKRRALRSRDQGESSSTRSCLVCIPNPSRFKVIAGIP